MWSGVRWVRGVAPPDRACLLALLAAPLAWFNRVLVPSLSGVTLLPFDILYQYEPWRSLRPGVVPYNALLGDLVLQAMPWKLFIRASLQAGQLPLWNPTIIGGYPFFASGQPGTLYPPSLLAFSLLPLPEGFAWYTLFHFWLAGGGTYAFARTLGLRPAAALFSALAWTFSGFLVVNVVFPNVLGVAAWLPWLLLSAELQLRGWRTRWAMAGGAIAVALQFLSGHPETSVYALLAMALYAALRGAAAWRSPARVARGWAGCAAMVLLGGGLAAIQLLPTWEALQTSVREGSRTLAEVVAFAWPAPQLWTLLLPDLFGNPSHHRWLDIWAGVWRPITANLAGEPIDNPFWGVKNYVEGGQYLGALSWLLAPAALLAGLARARGFGVVWLFAALALGSLLFMLGTPLYALLEFGLPGFRQLRTPFRWVFPFTFAVAMLAGLGLEALLQADRPRAKAGRKLIGGLGIVVGLALSAVVLASLARPGPFLTLSALLLEDGRVARGVFEAAGERLPAAFASPSMFWSYQALGLLRLAVVALLGGGLLLGLGTHRGRRTRSALAFGLSAVLLADLYSIQGRFFPAVDVGLSPLAAAGRPLVVDFLAAREERLGDGQPGSGQPWRFTTFDAGGEKTLNANAGAYYGWQDVRGYESIIPRPYADLTRRIFRTYDDLAFNRIAPVYGDPALLDSPLLNLLNVKYVISAINVPNVHLVEVYRDAAVGVYENQRVLPRAFLVSGPPDQPPTREPQSAADLVAPATITRYDSALVDLAVDAPVAGWLVLADAYAPGWRAAAAGPGRAVADLPVAPAYEALRSVYLSGPGRWAVRFTYQPESVRQGGLLSAASALALLGGLWLGPRLARVWNRGRTRRVSSGRTSVHA